MTSFHLWLDDTRRPPPSFGGEAGDVRWCRTATEAIALLERAAAGDYRLEAISLDYHLDNAGPRAGTGMAVARWLAEAWSGGRLPPCNWSVHTSNEVMKARMEELLLAATR